MPKILKTEVWRGRDGSLCTSHHFQSGEVVHIAGEYLAIFESNGTIRGYISMDCYASIEEQALLAGELNAKTLAT